MKAKYAQKPIKKVETKNFNQPTTNKVITKIRC